MPFIILTSGCVPLILGGAAGALGAYAIRNDTIEADITEQSYNNLWNAALVVAMLRGTIKQRDKESGYLHLDLGSGKVWIRLIRLTRSTVRLRVSARKFHFPSLGLAQEIFVEIMEESG